jgi:NDP-sugar pyrophosphorylase family protein
MIPIDHFIHGFSSVFPNLKDLDPWDITNDLLQIIEGMIPGLGSDFNIKDGIAIHKSAVIEQHVVIKGPAIIGEHCFIGANAYLRGGVFLDHSVRIGPGCEIKQSIIFSETAAAHFNYIGNSIVGHQVNLEAGSVVANHYNERVEKRIFVIYESGLIDTKTEKFGALIGDNSRIGANSVCSPGTILNPNSIVKRLELVDQLNA